MVRRKKGRYEREREREGKRLVSVMDLFVKQYIFKEELFKNCFFEVLTSIILGSICSGLEMINVLKGNTS